MRLVCGHRGQIKSHIHIKSICFIPFIREQQLTDDRLVFSYIGQLPFLLRNLSHPVLNDNHMQAPFRLALSTA